MELEDTTGQVRAENVETGEPKEWSWKHVALRHPGPGRDG